MLLVPLFAISVIARRIIPAGTAYVDLLSADDPRDDALPAGCECGPEHDQEVWAVGSR